MLGLLNLLLVLFCGDSLLMQSCHAGGIYYNLKCDNKCVGIYFTFPRLTSYIIFPCLLNSLPVAIANFTLPLGPPNYFFSISDNEPGSNSNEQILAHLVSQGHSSYQIVLSIQRVPTLTLPLSLLITPLVISGLGVENWSQLLSLSLYNILCVIALLLTHIFVCSLSPSNNNNKKKL